MKRIAAIDFGTKRIGLAISDMSRSIALPIGTVEGGKKAIQNIREALPLKEVDLILVGLPLEMSGKKGPMAEMVEEFAKILENALAIPVRLVDERLSSKEADMELKKLAMKGKKRAEKIDSVAAMILLKSYLESQR